MFRARRRNMIKRVVLALSLVCVFAWPSKALAASEPPNAPSQLVQLMYCTDWGGCYLAFFYLEDVENVVASGGLHVYWDGSWGGAGGEMLAITDAPQPVDPGGGGPTGCGDDRDELIRQYTVIADRFGWIPECTDFSSGASTPHFSWSMLNHSEDNYQQPWGIIQAGLLTGVENTRVRWADTYGFGDLRITSGYRSPEVNASTSALAPWTSNHMRGTAVDLLPVGFPGWDQTVYGILLLAATEVGGKNPESWQAANGTHLHIEF